MNTERFPEAEEVFKQKLEVSGNDPTVQEEIEDVQLHCPALEDDEGGKKAKKG